MLVKGLHFVSNVMTKIGYATMRALPGLIAGSVYRGMIVRRRMALVLKVVVVQVIVVLLPSIVLQGVIPACLRRAMVTFAVVPLSV